MIDGLHVHHASVSGYEWASDAGPSWRDAAACKGVSELMWLPKHAGPRAVRTARAVCESCPVLDDCRDWVLGINQRVFGVVAGMSERERQRARRSRSEATCAA